MMARFIKKKVPQFEKFTFIEIQRRLQQSRRKTAGNYLWCVMYGMGEHGVDCDSYNYSKFQQVQGILVYYLLDFDKPSRPRNSNQISIIQLDEFRCHTDQESLSTWSDQ